MIIEEQEDLGEAERIKLQFAAVFDACIREANGSDGVSVAEYEVPRFQESEQTSRILDKIFKGTPPNQADVIAIRPLNAVDTTRHIFFLRRVEGEGEGQQSLLTFFEIEHIGKEVRSAELLQIIKNGDEVREKILKVDPRGNFVDIHSNGDGRESPLTDAVACRPDLSVVSDSVGEASLEEAVRHTTQEFDRVVRIDQAVPISSRIGGAAAGFKRPDRIAA